MWDQTDWLPQLQAVGLIALAGLLGGVIGLEREWARKPAGLRTHIVVASASAFFMALGHAVIWQFSSLQPHGTVVGDPVRVMQAVVVGISFLGAGTIIHEGGQRIEGLTTAASLLLTSAIGMAVAAGQIITATLTTLISVIILLLLGNIELRILRRSEKS